MVRLADLPDYEREHLIGKNLEPLGATPCQPLGKPLGETRFALITTAGIHARGARNFALTDASFRPIDGRRDGNDLVMSHSSVNFDRTGFQADTNVVFPIDRFRELEAAGVIGDLADVHYSFMGAGLLPAAYEDSVNELADLLLADGVDAVFLTPV